MKKLVAIGLSLLMGCASSWDADISQQRAEISSAHIGCSAQDIEIINTGNADWEAYCNDKKYFCTVAPSASCAEAQSD